MLYEPRKVALSQLLDITYKVSRGAGPAPVHYSLRPFIIHCARSLFIAPIHYSLRPFIGDKNYDYQTPSFFLLTSEWAQALRPYLLLQNLRSNSITARLSSVKLVEERRRNSLFIR